MGSLSGGERQLVWLAQGLVQDGAFWLLDEPTQHLDAARRAYLFLLLQRLATDYGKTLLVATHELNALAQLPQAQYLDMLNPERGFVPCTPAALASTLEAHKQASGLF
jgi:ABC-type cobalamin/Fe3+-siderophores transport system ATPase subunit